MLIINFVLANNNAIAWRGRSAIDTTNVEAEQQSRRKSDEVKQKGDEVQEKYQNRISDEEYQQRKENIKKAEAIVNKLEEKVHKGKNLKEKE